MAFINDTAIPHASFPWRMITQPDGTLGLDVDDQDSLDEIISCVSEIVVCPIGAWDDQPTFGVPSQVFAQTPVDTTGIAQAIQQWEPRAAVLAQESPDAYDAAIRNIVVTISTPQQDQ